MIVFIQSMTRCSISVAAEPTARRSRWRSIPRPEGRRSPPQRFPGTRRTRRTWGARVPAHRIDDVPHDVKRSVHRRGVLGQWFAEQVANGACCRRRHHRYVRKFGVVSLDQLHCAKRHFAKPLRAGFDIGRHMTMLSCAVADVPRSSTLLGAPVCATWIMARPSSSVVRT